MKLVTHTLASLLMISAASAFSGCASTGAKGDAPAEVALRRGGSWATYSIKPPRIVGPTAALELKDDSLHGMLASRSMDVKITDGGASGFGPGGPVNITITPQDGQTIVDGLWNGGPVHFVFAPDGVKGSVVVWQGRMAAQQASCSYTLDKLEPSGAHSGVSICGGMPQDTRLEVLASTAKVLDPNELAVLLVAAFSAPPLATNEGI
jgi:hypothetical protein